MTVREDDSGKRWYNFEYEGMTTSSDVDTDMEELRRIFRAELTDIELREYNEAIVFFFLIYITLYRLI